MEKDNRKQDHSGLGNSDSGVAESEKRTAQEEILESPKPYMEQFEEQLGLDQPMSEPDEGLNGPSVEEDQAFRLTLEAPSDTGGLGSESTGPTETLDGGTPNEANAEGDEMDSEELNQVIEDICRSKAAEFRMLGYEHVTGAEIWECVSDKYRKTGVPQLHRVVNDILTLKVTQFMNWLTMKMYKDAQS